MNIYVYFDKNAIIITPKPPACGIFSKWEEQTLTTEKLRELQDSCPDSPIILAESLIGVVKDNDKKAVIPRVASGEKPLSPNSNRLKFELKKVGKKTYLEREMKPQQDHIARHNAPLPTDRDKEPLKNFSTSLPEYHYTKLLEKHKSEILSNPMVMNTLYRVSYDLICQEDDLIDSFSSDFQKAIKKVFKLN